MRFANLRHAWLIVTLLSTTLACQLVSQLSETRERVESVATDAKAGINTLGTARALVTQVGSSAMLQTAQALATEAGESGLLQTAIAVATEEGPSAIETAKAFVTQEGPALEETAQAALTQIAGSMGEPPVDIPVIAGEKEDLITGEFAVSYSVSMDIEDVADFYKREMPREGWTPIEQGNLESENMFSLNFEKPDRSAAVTIISSPVNQQTIVFILIVEK
jgi:hypothetical protein